MSSWASFLTTAASQLHLLCGADLVNPENSARPMADAAAAPSPCCDEDPGCALVNVVDHFIFWFFLIFLTTV